MFFDNSIHNKNKNKNVSLTNTQLPEPKQVECVNPYEVTGNPTAIIDIECYPNYFEVGIKFLESSNDDGTKNAASEKYIFFEIYNNDQGAGHGIYSINGYVVCFNDWCNALSFVLHRFLTVGFNSIYYDLPLIFEALKGQNCQQLKAFSNEIIQDRKRVYSHVRDKLNHIDVMEVAPLHDGLKTYAGRIHAPRMQELPYEHWRMLTEQECFYVRSYNVNDLDNTGLLYSELKGQIRLREKLGKRYGLDLRSKSDAQVAEAVIQSELNKAGIRSRAPSIDPGTAFFYTPPDFIQFKTPQLQRVLEVVKKTQFVIGNDGSANTPKAIRDLKIKLGNTSYQMGNGGLHSKEECVAYFATPELQIIDRDVESYYPRIILNQNLYPEHLGPGFCVVFNNIVELRLDCKGKAKKYKNEANIELYIYWDEESSSLKISINGIFGKHGNKYSVVYSPKLVTQVTVSGQLQLLMLIEDLTLAGFNVISANTDGIVTLVPTNRKVEFDTIVGNWEKVTAFKTEETSYLALLNRDVNNYMALKEKGDPNAKYIDEQLGFKTKGIYSERGSALNSVLSKNPETYICSMAVMEFIKNKKPIKETIENCKDISRFVSVRKVEGGAQKNGQFLGKVIRWYYAEGETGTINYVKNGNSVPKSEGAKPLMDLPEAFPNDINYAWYVNEATQMLFDIGYYQKVKTGDMFS